MKKRKGLIIGLSILLLINVTVVFIVVRDYQIIMGDKKRQQLHQELLETIGANDEMTEEELEDCYLDAVGDAMMEVTLSGVCYAEDGKLKVSFANGEDSPCSVKLKIIDLSNDITIAETDYLSPGYYLKDTDVLVTLPEGKYQCHAELSFYMIGYGEIIGETGRSIILIVN